MQHLVSARAHRWKALHDRINMSRALSRNLVSGNVDDVMLIGMRASVGTALENYCRGILISLVNQMIPKDAQPLLKIGDVLDI